MIWALPLMVTLVATAEVKGTPEPCGCTSDPLGDVARVATLAKGGLWLDAGSLLYNREELSKERTPQADATAAALAHIYGGARVGLGADDLPRGAARVKPARQACNVARGMALEAPRVVTIDGVRIGVFGVAAPAAGEAAQGDRAGGGGEEGGGVAEEGRRAGDRGAVRDGSRGHARARQGGAGRGLRDRRRRRGRRDGRAGAGGRGAG